MAKTLMLILVSLVLIISIHFESAAPFEDEENEEGEYVVDSEVVSKMRRPSRFLSSVIKKGTSCDAKKKTHEQICNGVRANKGTSLLYCCKKHCRNVLGDRNNCGRCGHKCLFGERCCAGVCTNVLYNNANCGKCNKQCRHGVNCGYGYCGYA